MRSARQAAQEANRQEDGQHLCPEAENELSKESIRKVVIEAISEMASDGSLNNLINPTATAKAEASESAFDFGDMMSAFRK